MFNMFTNHNIQHHQSYAQPTQQAIMAAAAAAVCSLPHLLMLLVVGTREARWQERNQKIDSSLTLTSQGTVRRRSRRTF